MASLLRRRRARYDQRKHARCDEEKQRLGPEEVHFLIFLADRGLRSERLHHRLVRLDVRPADQVDAVGHGGEDARNLRQPLQRLADRFRLSGQIDDQRALADHRHLAGEDRGGHELQADGAHLLAEAGHHLVGDRERRLGRDVARRGSGAAGGEHQVAAALVHQLLQRPLDHRLLVGDEPRLVAPLGRGDGAA